MKNVLKTIGLLGLVALPALAQGSKVTTAVVKPAATVANGKSTELKAEAKPAVVAEAPAAVAPTHDAKKAAAAARPAPATKK